MEKKINVAIVSFPINTFGGGFDIFYNWLRTLDKELYDVHFITCSNKFYEMNKRLCDIPGIHTINIPGLSKWYLLYIPGVISLINYFRRNNIEIVHTSMLQADIIGSFAAKISNTPVTISTVIGYLINTSSGLRGKLKSFVYRAAYGVTKNFFDKIITISRATSDELEVDFGVNPRILEVNYCGIELPEKASASMNKCEAPQIVGVIGELIPSKGMGVFVAAIPSILKKHPKTEFIIAGDGAERKVLSERVANMGLGEKVKFLGWVDNPREVIQNMDIFVFPSLPSYDGLPRVILEAWALGTPVIATRVACVPELFDGKNKGITIKPGCSAEIAASVNKLIQNPEMAKQMADNALEEIGEFDVRVEVNRLEKIYAGLVDARKADRSAN
jgi:glycosyltransferase involved in cell wall biosynthesis